LSVAAAAHARSLGQPRRVQLDAWLIGGVAGLLLVGLVMVASASIGIAERELGEPFHYFQKQLTFVLLGLAAALAAFCVPTEAWERTARIQLGLAFLLLLLVLIPGIGHEVNGSRRWVRLGFMNFQVSELARVMLLTYLASYAVRRRDELTSSFKGFMKPVGVMMAAAALLLIEPDFGATTVLMATGLAVLFLAGVRFTHFMAPVAAGVGLLGLLAVSSDYRLRRLTAFVDPWKDPLDSGYQLIQSLIAVGRGDWFGVGLGASVQKLFYLPEAHTDFLFAVLAEELGLVGVVLTLALFVALVLRSFWIARLAADSGLKFAAYLAAGFGLWVGIQSLINIGVNMGVLPTKGLTLPLMSYGRSSLIVTLAWVGLLLRVYHEAASLARGSATARRRDVLDERELGATA
jgi:cell division protein FtsW